MWKKSDNGFGANRKKIGDEVMIKLLLVEDDANLCYIIRGGLEDMIGGYEVTTAADGDNGRFGGRQRRCGPEMNS